MYTKEVFLEKEGSQKKCKHFFSNVGSKLFLGSKSGSRTDYKL